MPDEVVYQVFNYAEDSFLRVPVGLGQAGAGRNDTCEGVCRWICQKLKIRPLVFSLVGLRLHGERWFVAGSSRPSTDKKYDFRVRFKVPDLSSLKTLDLPLFNYYYSQLRCDLLQNRIPEIDYRKYKNKILGYVVNDMYRKMIEDNVSLNELRRDFEKYIPRKISREHQVCFFNVAQKRIFESLSLIRNKDHDVNYVKNVYINDIDNIAPGYLYEEYSGDIRYPKGEFTSRTGKCPVKLRFQPYGTVSSREPAKYDSNGLGHHEGSALVEADDALASPGLKVFYSCKWQHVTNIDEILTILVENLTVKLALEDQPEPYCIDFHDQTELNSFVTCLAGYYRLMCKWTVYLCQDYLSSPSLDWLKELKCHGPIGGKYSTDKIRVKNSSLGACVIRQCEDHYDTYFADMLEEAEVIKTYKLTYTDDGQWNVQRGKETVYECSCLPEALKSLNPDIASVYRLPPSDNDTAPKLLLCRPTAKTSPKRLLRGSTQDLGQKRACIINASKELVINRNALEDESDGFTQRTRADFLLPSNSKIEVSLKLLKSDREGEHLKDFLQIAGQWATIDSIDIIKLYGMTLCKPITMVLEYGRYGRLDEFLRSRRLRPTALIEVGHSLARAIYYLQKHGIHHGNIRCSSMLVTQFDADDQRIVAKLSDPGMHGQRRLTKHDLLWLPYEYQDLSDESVAKLRQDPLVDVWACISTLWEIFSRGRKMHVYKPVEFLPTRMWLQTMVGELRDCKQICECLTFGWHTDPDKRLAPQMIVGLLVHARQLDSYCTVGNGHANGAHSGGGPNMLNGSFFKSSILSMETNSTLVRTDCTSSSYVSNGSDSELRSNASSGSSSMPLISNRANHFSGDSYLEKTFYDCPDYIQHGGARIFFHETLGEGNYGRVYRGTLEEGNTSMVVALKTIHDDRPDMGRVRDDFIREVDIMKSLRHRNIVHFIRFIDDHDKLVVVMEYVAQGSLLSFLGYQRHNLEELDLLRMARDIANGMHYLFEKKIVHRDLATRNILVESVDCVKISDFGLAQVTEGGNYYVVRHKRELPLRWYAPETLETQKYSFQSDVWSYGVTLYEMFTYGGNPYSNVDIQTAEQLYQLLQKEKKILQLPEVFSYVYDKLMEPCFKRNPHERPSFQDLMTQLDEMIGQYGELL
ncbi:tyrosine-protein kinase hopscotch [Anopheles bellator]|uniref:tyrosine-protein kinase hopscotch n=1 Tax=Anopheles bellator TaxID=139047 RepID=UPI002647DD4B|nr:tyrosine-protein kinase hopscotch [Anopheles bellator]